MIRATLLLVILLCTTAMMPQEHFVQHPFDAIKAKEVQCMTDVIYREAPEESYAGKLAVGTVVMNRVHMKGYPKTVCSVVYQKGQFSWTRFKLHAPNPKLYAEARTIALSVLSGKRLVSIKNAVFFHNTSVQPNWDHVRPILQIGNHAFYVAVR
jgi:N-acetylmuramoyl-L-alanine amidase